jgi:membrane-associated phospholipid phosphatase
LADAAIDARVQTDFGGHPQVLSVVAELGQPRAVAAMTAALALACVVCRRYRGAALLALSVPIAAVITELLLKPYIGRYFGSSLTFPSGHATGVFALATAVTVLLTARRPYARCASSSHLSHS